MPNFTPTYMLPYPAPSDSPCTLSDTWCDFATAVDGQFDALDTILDRTATTVPMAMIATSGLVITTNSAAAGNIPIVYDTVLVDTDNMVDLTVNPNGMKVNTPGIYMRYINAHILAVNPAPGSGQLQSNIVLANGQTTDQINDTVPFYTSSINMPIELDRNRLPNICFTMNRMGIFSAGFGMDSSIFVSTASSGENLYYQARMGLVWMRDPL